MNQELIGRALAAGSGALALGLLLNTIVLPSGRVAALPVAAKTRERSLSRETLSMPVAPVSSQIPPTSSEEDIRVSRQSRHNPTSCPRAAVAAGIIALTAALFAFWRWIRHGRFFAMTPGEVALQHLHEARRLMDPDNARDYGSEVAGILRRYIQERFGLQSRPDHEEVFRDFAGGGSGRASNSQRSSFAEFLQHYESAQRAGWRCCWPDLEHLHRSAEYFVHLADTPESESKNGLP